MRFSIRTLLLIIVFLTVIFAIFERVTHESRARRHIEFDLRSMGAYHVGFDKGSNKPDWVSFVVPVKSAQIAKYKSFRHIDFAGAHMTDDSVRYVAALQHVEAIHLTDCDITDYQIGLLAEIGGVEILRLNGSPVTDAAISAIASIDGLKSVDLSGTLVTDEGFATLRARCPGIFVRH